MDQIEIAICTPEKQREWWNVYRRMMNGLKQIYI